MTSPSPSPITAEGEGISDRILVGALETAMPELGDGLTVTLSREMVVLYDPLEASESRATVTPLNKADTLIAEYDLPALFSLRMYGCSYSLVLLLFTV